MCFCIGWVLDIQMILCIELINLYVQMFIPCVNDHCDHYLKWLFLFVQAMLYCFNLYYLIALCLLHMHFKISAYNDHLVLLFSVKTCSYGSRASHNLELGVSEFWQLFPTHILSLEFVLGFCHGIAKMGDCKVEFIQPYVHFIPC